MHFCGVLGCGHALAWASSCQMGIAEATKLGSRFMDFTSEVLRVFFPNPRTWLLRTAPTILAYFKVGFVHQNKYISIAKLL